MIEHFTAIYKKFLKVDKTLEVLVSKPLDLEKIKAIFFSIEQMISAKYDVQITESLN